MPVGADEVSASEAVVRVSCGGGAVTANDTFTFCEVPAQGLGARQATVMAVVYGDPVTASDNAALVSDTLMPPGLLAEPFRAPVALNPVTLSHGAAGLTESWYPTGVATPLEVIARSWGSGTSVAPSAIANPNETAESTKSTACDRTTNCAGEVAGFCAASVTLSVKLLVPADVGVPPITPFVRLNPAGRFS